MSLLLLWDDMKVMLINPPVISDIKRVLGVNGVPLGLIYLASVARNEGHEIKFLDASAEGMDLNSVKSRVRDFYPDMVGVTATTPAFYDACDVARVSKEVNKDIITVIGGPHVTFVPKYTLKKCPYLDIVVRGEGEVTFKEILTVLKGLNRSVDSLNNILGLTYRKENGKIVHNPPRPLIQNMDDLPIPSYDLINWDRYSYGKLRYGVIMTSRGCPFDCVFCSSSLQFGKRWRGHSAERVIEEIKILYDDFKIREIEFLDDTFTLNRKRAQQISDEIVKEGMDISWSASSRVNTIDRETAEKMKRAGAHTIYFGIESGTQKILDFIGKGITLEQAIRAVKIAVKVGLNSLGSFIIGFPMEKKEDIERTVKFAKKLDVTYAQFTIATPYPGTRLWYYALKNNLIKTLNWRLYTTTRSVMKSFYLTTEQIERALVKAYLSFYLRPKYAIRDLLKGKSSLLLRTALAIMRSIRGLMGAGKAEDETLDEKDLEEIMKEPGAEFPSIGLTELPKFRTPYLHIKT